MSVSFFKYLKFLFTSCNQHGVHSPFVYNFITRSLYTKPRYKGNKVFDILLKSIGYFNARIVHFPTENSVLKDVIQESFPKTVFKGKPYDIIYLEHPEEDPFQDYGSLGNAIQNDSMVLINSIHKNRKAETHWENIKKWEHVTVTIDFFHCGAVFFRKEQAEEHFKIRI
ncbi:hypothetical protein [Ulvibacterium sp.]|uniref:hypothetical protein n=1 Tax=Ulvibacterium sp. TaxID=2665914 RepID=UPI002610F88D|nr:hypothetical protein [Ulvibacterium sp.]